jgi:serine/threonine protein kinase/tetratricopeptide (TPR) repeat protein
VNEARWRAVQDLFLAARERPAAERIGYLESASPNDDEVLANVKRMLAADASEGILDRDAPTFTLLGSPSDEPVQERVGPYLINGELGRGGMGVVYRAYDPRLRRDVALKFLPLAWNEDRDAKGRFINEARAASALDHPHTCPVYDIGSTEDGRSYIAMAYCAGGSLAQRLASGPLPIDEAVDVAVAVASALDRAHNAGIIHRDIKPGNIAFTEDGYARVLDFGVAVLGTGEWATPSIAAGTPAYMAPEQIRGDAVDRRTDVWALGVVLFEMLTGRRPFSGGRREVTHAILNGEPNDIRVLRPAVPSALASAVRKALSRNPDQRFATAAEFSAAISTALVTPADALQAHAISRRRARRIGLAAAAIVVVAAGGFFTWRARQPASPATSLDPNAVAILPFRVRGEPAMQYLREGMVDLLAAKLTGEGGLRAADPRGVYAAWRRVVSNEREDLTSDSAVALARRLGAGQVMLGDVVGTANGIVVNASITNDRGRVIGRATAQGAHAELSNLVDRLVAQLLSASAGEEPQRLGALTSTSLPALRAYLEGQAAYRRGRYAEALEKFGRAVDFDSTFALAGLGLSLADGWVGTGHARDRGRAVAWRWRDRLSARDLALLKVTIGPAYPRVPTIKEQLAATEAALRLSPDRMELWYTLGDLYFHHGKIISDANWEANAERAMRRAIEADSAFAPPLQHLVGLYARQGRHDDLRALVNASRMTIGADGASADFIDWRWRVALGQPLPDTAALDSMASETLGWIGIISQDDGVVVPFGERAIRLRSARPSTREEQLERHLSVHAVALNGGRPRAAALMSETIRAYQPDSAFHLRLRVLAALYGDGDKLTAERAATALGGQMRTETRWLNQCVRLQWRLSALSATGDSLSDVRPAGVRGSSAAEQLCDAAVDALRAVRRGDASVGQAIARLDAILRVGLAEFYPGDGYVDYGHLALARVLELRGDRSGALVAVRRRPYFIGWQPFLAASLRHEGRLAAALGDRAGAIRAYEHHLALRHDPEPSMRASSDSVEAELARLKSAR